MEISHLEYGKVFSKTHSVTDFQFLDRSDDYIKQDSYINELLNYKHVDNVLNVMKTGEISISFFPYKPNKSYFIVRQKRTENEFFNDSSLRRPFFQTKIVLLDNIEIQGFVSNGTGVFSSLIAQLTQKSNKESESDVSLKDYFVHGETVSQEINLMSVLPIEKSNNINILNLLIRLSDHFDLTRGGNTGLSNSTPFVINGSQPETTRETIRIIDLLQFYLLPFTNSLFSFAINYETESGKPNLVWLKQK